jgi:small subunit ribosomal protein S17
MRMEGVVKRNSMSKTVVVEVSRRRPHPQYGRLMTRLTKVFAHVNEEIPVGARVIVEESKPVSKLKRWVVVQVIKDNKEN